MALFSRRDKSGSVPEPVPEQPTEPAPVVEPEVVPHVGISVSTFGQGAESARSLPDAEAADPPPVVPAARAAAAAPAATQTVPGMIDNTLLQAALAALPEQPQSGDVMNVMRQALQGPLYVRAQGDAQALLAAGQGLSLAVTTHEDKRFLLAFTGGASMQLSVADEPAAATSVVGQSAANILRMAVDSGYDGIYLDHSVVGARLVLPVTLVQKAIDEGAPPPFELKAALSGERTDATATQVAEILGRVPVWAAGGTDAEGRIGLAEARTADGVRRLEIFSHPLEVLAMGRGDRPLSLAPEQLAAALASDPALTGVVVDAAGPWIELDRDALAPLLALAG